MDRPTRAELLALLKKSPRSFSTMLVKQFVLDETQRWIAEDLAGAQSIDDAYDDMGGNDLAIMDELAPGAQYEGISLREVYSLGGGEGGGESVVRVWAVVVGAKRKKPTADQKKWQIQPDLDDSGEVIAYIRGVGYYESHNGIGWDDNIEFVEPHQVITTVYLTAQERKKSKEEFVTNLAKD